MILSLVLSILGCSVADGEVQALTPEGTRPPAHSMEDFQELGPREMARTMAWVRYDMEALSPERHAEVSDAMRTLAVTCSYTRASHQLPLVLEPRVAAINPEHVEPAAREDLGYLKQGLADHVAVLDALDVTLPIPEQGDFLFGHANLVDRAGLAMLLDPIQNTHDQLGNIRTYFPRTTKELVTASFAQVESTGHHSSFKFFLMGWHRTLESIAPHVLNPDTKADVDAMIALLQDHSDRGC